MDRPRSIDARKSVAPGRRAASARPGTQAIQRAALVLRLLAAGPGGIRFADVVKRSGLEHPTAHRILKGLIAAGLAVHEPGSRHYALGPLVFELGLAARPQLDLASLCAPALDRIAAKTGDTVFLTARSGYDSVCVDRRSGSFPIKTLTLDVGTRRPLGVGAGGLALLFLLGAREVEEIVAANAHRVGSYNNLTASALLASVERSRRLGYALNDVHNTTGATTLGLPIVNRYGHPFAALSVGTISSRMPRERQVEIAAMLRAEIRQIESALRAAMPSPVA